MLACIYDVHGNLPALEAVLEDARRCGAGRFLLGGDYALFGGWPAEVLDRLEALGGAAWVRGNVDRWTAEPAGAPEHVQAPVAACREALGAARADRLIDLPESQTEGDTLFVHASPASDMDSFIPDRSDEDERLLAGVGARRVVFGHTHMAFARRGAGGIELLNPGSVGMPLDGDQRASYALIHDDGRIEHRRVAYDHEASARRLLEAFPGAEWTGIYVERLRTARM